MPTVDVHDVDAVEAPARTIRLMHRRGTRVVCYVSAGSWEQWRPDARDFPQSLIGREFEGWPGERWLDIRNPHLRPLLEHRVRACARRGFDGIEFDNVDAFTAESGFPITARQQLRFNRWLANTAHRHGLAVGLKNDPTQVRHLVRWFDFSLVEQCFEYHECSSYLPFVRARKPVFVAEYDRPLSSFCSRARRMRFIAARFTLALDGRFWACPWPR